MWKTSITWIYFVITSKWVIRLDLSCRKKYRLSRAFESYKIYLKRIILKKVISNQCVGWYSVCGRITDKYRENSWFSGIGTTRSLITLHVTPCFLLKLWKKVLKFHLLMLFLCEIPPNFSLQMVSVVCSLKLFFTFIYTKFFYSLAH